MSINFSASAAWGDEEIAIYLWIVLELCIIFYDAAEGVANWTEDAPAPAVRVSLHVLGL